MISPLIPLFYCHTALPPFLCSPVGISKIQSEEAKHILFLIMCMSSQVHSLILLCDRGEFWLGNDHIHLMTKAKDMIMRIELEDFEGVREYAKYDQFYVANEYLRYRLSVSGYRYSI